MRISDWSSDVCSSDLVRRNYGQEFIALGHVGDNSQEESHSASVEQNVAHGVQCVARSTRRGLLRLTVGCFENRQEQIVAAWEIVGDVRLAKDASLRGAGLRRRLQSLFLEQGQSGCYDPIGHTVPFPRHTKIGIA